MSRLRLVLALAGFVFAALGVMRDDHVMAWVAIACLGAAFLLRTLQRRLERDRRDARADTDDGTKPDPPA